MAQPRPSAAYLRATQGSAPDSLARQHAAVAEVASWRGWPAPTVYADDSVPPLADGYGPALARLEAAISAGRHDRLLLAGPATLRGNPARLMRLLASCTKHGVAVEVLGPPAPHDSQGMPGRPARRPRRGRRRAGQDRRNSSRSALIVGASVVGMPCGKP
jgi:Resolvase, N terminal domain